MKKRTKNKITIAVFLSVVLGLSAVNLILPDKNFSENENRPLQTFPPISFSELTKGTYMTKFESYTTDQFPARDAWVELKVNTDLAVQKKDTNGVYFAKDGYLIERFSEHELNKTQLATNEQRVKEFVNSTAASLGNDHVRVLIAPTAGDILADKLPAYAPSLDQQKILTEFAAQLPAGVFVNTSETLSAHKDERPVYYHTDHHWTSYGAFLVYQEWMISLGLAPKTESDFNVKQVSDEFYGTIYSKANNGKIDPDIIEVYEPKEASSYTVDFDFGKRQGTTLYNTDYLNKKDKYAMFLDGNNSMVSIKSEADSAKKLLIVKDSYAHSFVPFAVEDFGQVDVLDLRYYHQPVSKLMEENGYTDVLVLYNLNTFSSDTNLGVLAQ